MNAIKDMNVALRTAQMAEILSGNPTSKVKSTVSTDIMMLLTQSKFTSFFVLVFAFVVRTLMAQMLTMVVRTQMVQFSQMWSIGWFITSVWSINISTLPQFSCMSVQHESSSIFVGLFIMYRYLVE